MKHSTVASKTMAIKARVYNQIRKDLYETPVLVIECSSQNIKKITNIDDFTTPQKLNLFNKWFELNKQAHNELNAYKRKRKEAKAIHEKRKESGYYTKKYEKSVRHYERKQQEIERLSPKIEFVSSINNNNY